MNKLFTLVFILALSSGYAFGQTLKAWETKAAEAFAAENYSAALAYNDILLEIDPDRADALYYAAESARHIRAFDKAADYFSRIPDSLKAQEAYSLTDFWQGSIAKSNGQIEQAQTFFSNYLAATTADNAYTQRAEEEIEQLAWTMKMLDDPSNVEVEHLSDKTNTVYADLAPLQYGENLYFTSAWFEKFGTEPRTRIYQQIGEATAIPFGYQPTDENQHVGHTSFNEDGSRMYFTICERDERTLSFMCQIYYQEKGTGDSWSTPIRLGNTVNQAGFTSTQPSIGSDPAGNEILFFASDRTGGQGNLDIWSATMTASGAFAEAVNLTAINTAQDDVTPFFHSDSKTLFFSSGGHQNLGGFDVFYTNLTMGEWTEPTNLGAPINSGFDDTYFSFNSTQGVGHFTSNRPGGLCAKDDQNCNCNDLYKANILVDLEAVTFNAFSEKEMTGATVQLINKATGETTTLKSGDMGSDFASGLDFGAEYLVVANKTGWIGDTVEVNTLGLIQSKTFAEKLELTPEIKLELLVYNALDKSSLDSGQVRLFENKDSEIDFKSNLAGNDFYFPLTVNKDYALNVDRVDYGFEKVTFDTRGITEPTTITRKVYLAKAVELPLVVYFDNDYPDPNSESTTASSSYAANYEHYITQRERFKRNFAKAKTTNKANASQEIDAFFDNEVKVGYDRLKKLAGQIESYLAQGFEIEIFIQGYASPLAPEDYNRALSQRRVHSVIQFFEAYNNGSIAPHLANKTFRVNEESFGEVNDTISDKGWDRPQSEFSPAASRERKAVIVKVVKSAGSLSLKY